MAKLTKRLNIKGSLNLEEGTFTEFDKDLGEITHNISDLLKDFDLLDEITLGVSHDNVVIPD